MSCGFPDISFCTIDVKNLLEYFDFCYCSFGTHIVKIKMFCTYTIKYNILSFSTVPSLFIRGFLVRRRAV